MRLRLIVPSLFQFSEQIPLPAGLSILRRSERRIEPGDWLESRLCQLFGLDTVPIAALTHELDRQDGKQNTGAPGLILRADPVHLAVHQNSMTVIAGEMLDLRSDEAEALGATVNLLLQDEGMALSTCHLQRWYLHLSNLTLTRFMPLPLAQGRALPPQTMQGPDAAQWKRRTAEIQMSLHQHPVNEAREQRGLLAINHIWIWGEGDTDRQAKAPVAQIWGDHIVLRALSRQSGTALLPIPSTFARWHSKANGDEHIVVLDHLLDSSRSGDIASWAAALDLLCDEWLEPALKAGLDEVTLEIPETEQSSSYTLGRWKRWSFWKNTHVGH